MISFIFVYKEKTILGRISILFKIVFFTFISVKGNFKQYESGGLNDEKMISVLMVLSLFTFVLAACSSKEDGKKNQPN